MNRKTEQIYDWAPLQHWRVVRQWVTRNYPLTKAEIEALLYLDPIDYFTINDFKDGTLTMTWDRKRFSKFLNNDWIKRIHDGRGRTGGHSKYVTTPKTRNLIRRIYRMLSGEELIPESEQANKIMARKSYTDKVYSQAIKKFNKQTRA